MDPTILTVSGKRFDLLYPKPEQIDIEDIAHALSKLCRFTGHCAGSEIYSVAQHSYIVSTLVPPQDALWGLLHDASEAYVGDVSSPLKRQLTAYRTIEQGIQDAVCAKFHLSIYQPASVKRADLVALATEKRDLMPFDPRPWTILDGVEPRERPITPLHSSLAKNLFLNRFHELRTIQHHARVLSRAGEPQCATA